MKKIIARLFLMLVCLGIPEVSRGEDARVDATSQSIYPEDNKYFKEDIKTENCFTIPAIFMGPCYEEDRRRETAGHQCACLWSKKVNSKEEFAKDPAKFKEALKIFTDQCVKDALVNLQENNFCKK